MVRSPQPRKTACLSSPVEKLLNSYTLAATAAGVGALALPPAAEAKIIYTPAHVQLQNAKPYALDLDHNGVVDFFLLQVAYPPGESGDYASELSVCHLASTVQHSS